MPRSRATPPVSSEPAGRRGRRTAVRFQFDRPRAIERSSGHLLLVRRPRLPTNGPTAASWLHISLADRSRPTAAPDGRPWRGGPRSTFGPRHAHLRLPGRNMPPGPPCVLTGLASDPLVPRATYVILWVQLLLILYIIPCLMSSPTTDLFRPVVYTCICLGKKTDTIQTDSGENLCPF